VIAIVNQSRGVPDEKPHLYTIQINNQRPLASFTHLRSDGLEVCLRRAADAVRKADDARMLEMLESVGRI
jgi:hypothetical protein